ncbi:Phospholipase/carboxylesterase/thioesterase [Penicillium cf. griseofulvum]|nr:Phospholipase/carboxylesterase/thioesterase [Penicillium cf. griseofulvum]KAJ5431634.1 Phospholipase/carboxylesterase/thioesterase [Penicillium cf. griseofulvum]
MQSEDSCEETESDEESEAGTYSEQGYDNNGEEIGSACDFNSCIEIQDRTQRDDFNPFEDEEEAPLMIQAMNYIRDILALPMIPNDTQLSEDTYPPSLSHLHTPVFSRL